MCGSDAKGVGDKNISYNINATHEAHCKNWISLIVKFAQLINADAVRLFDSNFFSQNGVSEDQHINELMVKTMEEIKKYTKSIVVFDLDSIAGLSKEWS